MKKVLIIDDNDIFATLISDSLPKEEYVVVHAINGLQGMELIKRENPDLILLDIMMPDVSGIDFLKQLKKQNPKNHIPIFVLSALSSTKDVSDAVTEGMGIGVRGYIVKGTQDLDSIIKKIIFTLKNK